MELGFDEKKIKWKLKRKTPEDVTRRKTYIIYLPIIYRYVKDQNISNISNNNNVFTS